MPTTQQGIWENFPFSTYRAFLSPPPLFAPAWYFLVQFHSYLFNYPSVDEHLGYFQFLIITNDAAIDNIVRLPFQTQASLSLD